MATLVTDNLLQTLTKGRRITSFDVTSGSSFEMLNIFDNSSSDYLFQFYDVNASTANVDMILQFGVAPSTWTTTGWYGTSRKYDGGGFATFFGQVSGFTIGNAGSAGIGWSSLVWVKNPNSSTELQTMIGMNFGDDNTGYQQTNHGLWRPTGTAFDSARVIPVSGTIARLRGSVYKL